MTWRKHDMRYSCFLPWLRWENILGDEERFCMSALLWRVKVDSYRKLFNTCREIFDKLSVISAKLNVHVTGVDEAEKDWRLFDI
ncbi:hypothetical protein ACFX15_001223 [Malus domestica]